MGEILSNSNCIIKPKGFTIPKKAVEIHRISNEKANNVGEDLGGVLKSFSIAISQADFLVAHNMSFDEKIVGAEFLRNEIPNKLFKKPRICTMISSIDYCKLSGPYGYKWPSLTELYNKLFNKNFKEAHDASVDVAACAKCFFELRSKKLI